MGRLYDTVRRIEYVIGEKQLPFFKTKGRIALEAGFSLGMIGAETPDDPDRISRLEAAARQILGTF